MKVTVEQLKDRVDLADELFLTWVADEVTAEESGQGTEYERVMDLRPDQLRSVVYAWCSQMLIELDRRDDQELDAMLADGGHAFDRDERTGRCTQCDHIKEMHKL